MVRAAGETAAQLRNGYGVGAQAGDLPAADGVRSVAVCGVGGSALPGDLVRALLQDRLGVPIVVSRGYRLPEFCHTDTLVVAVSYSGNTEETVGAYREAVARGCRVVAVTSGGELLARAGEDGVAAVRVPGDAPVPRAALGYLAGATLGLLEATGLGPAVGADVEEASSVLEEGARTLEEEGEPHPARDLAAAIGDRVPVIWGSEGPAEAAAIRWRTQFNENAKRPAFSSAFPELDHNEIEGWAEGWGQRFFLVILRHGAEHPSTGPRVEATLRAIEGSELDHAEVTGAGHSALAQALSLIQVGDYVSCYVATEDGVETTPIERIQALKAALKELT